METDWNGTFSVEIGNTGISIFEAGGLAPGDVVLTETEAGCPHRALYGDAPIGLCEMIVFGREKTMGARVVDSEYFPGQTRLPRRQDVLGEVLPASVRIGRVSFDLTIAHRLERNAVINLDTPSSGPENAYLSLAGVPIATGTVAILDERYGIRLDRIVRAFPRVAGVRTTGAVVRSDQVEELLIFDFSRPDCFSRDQIGKLAAIHRLVAGNLGPFFPGLQLARIDQMTFAEARNFFKKQGLQEIETMELVRRPAPNGGPPGKERRADLLYEAPDCTRPLSPESRETIEQSNSLQGIMQRSPVFFYANPDPATGGRDLSRAGDIPGAVSAGWRDLVDFRLNELRDQDEAIVVPDYEMTVIVEFTDTGDRPAAGLLYPYLTLEPYLAILGQ